MFDTCFISEDLTAIAHAYNNSTSAQSLVSFHDETAIISEYGFNVTFHGKFSTRMSGSNQRQLVYVYKTSPEASNVSNMTVAQEFQAGFDLLKTFQSQSDPAQVSYVAWLDQQLAENLLSTSRGRSKGEAAETLESEDTLGEFNKLSQLQDGKRDQASILSRLEQDRLFVAARVNAQKMQTRSAIRTQLSYASDRSANKFGKHQVYVVVGSLAL